MIDITQEEKEYRGYLKLCNFQSSTVSMYTRTLRKFVAHVEENFGSVDLDQKYAEHYLLLRLEQGKSWSSINVDYDRSTVNLCAAKCVHSI